MESLLSSLHHHFYSKSLRNSKWGRKRYGISRNIVLSSLLSPGSPPELKRRQKRRGISRKILHHHYYSQSHPPELERKQKRRGTSRKLVICIIIISRICIGTRKEVEKQKKRKRREERGETPLHPVLVAPSLLFPEFESASELERRQKKDMKSLTSLLHHHFY